MSYTLTSVFRGVVSETKDSRLDFRFPEKSTFRGVVVEDWNNWKDIRYPEKTKFCGIVMELLNDTAFPQIIRRK